MPRARPGISAAIHMWKLEEVTETRIHRHWPPRVRLIRLWVMQHLEGKTRLAIKNLLTFLKDLEVFFIDLLKFNNFTRPYSVWHGHGGDNARITTGPHTSGMRDSICYFISQGAPWMKEIMGGRGIIFSTEYIYIQVQRGSCNSWKSTNSTP